jgi:hypothetical protein
MDYQKDYQKDYQWIFTKTSKTSMSKKFPYPEAKTPVPSRKNNAREAPKTSHVLSGLTPNRFGSGGLKPGGAANVTDDDDDGERPCFCSSSVLTEVLESEELGVALTETVVLCIFRSGNGLRRSGGDERLRAVAMVSRWTEWRGEQEFWRFLLGLLGFLYYFLVFRGQKCRMGQVMQLTYQIFMLF